MGIRFTGLTVQALRIYVVCFAVIAGLSALFMLYLALRYGWTSALDAVSYEDAEVWLKGIIIAPGFAAGAYVLEKLLVRAWPKQRKE